jgi:hypothetical protein
MKRRGGAAGGRGSTRPAPRLRVGSQGGISDAIVPGGGTDPGTSLMKVYVLPCDDYRPIRPAVSTIFVENPLGPVDSPAAALDQLDSDQRPERSDGRQARGEKWPGRLASHHRPEDQGKQPQVAESV